MSRAAFKAVRLDNKYFSKFKNINFAQIKGDMRGVTGRDLFVH